MHNERNTVLNRIAAELEESRSEKKRQRDDLGDEQRDDKQTKKLSTANTKIKQRNK
jgi:hypothetical protein